MKSKRPNKIEIIVPESIQNFILKEQIGKGSFGEIYKAKHNKTNNMVAVKFETRIKKQSYLFFEGKLYEHFHDMKMQLQLAFIGIPEVYFCGKVNDYNVMIMEILGPALSDLFIKCKK
jgi:serine/threonine protein kinase